MHHSVSDAWSTHVVLATRETFIDAMAYELPVNLIEQAFPDFLRKTPLPGRKGGRGARRAA